MNNNNLSGYHCYNASAGTGKTTTIINLIDEAVKSKIMTNQTLMLAFENTAKDTMINRLEQIGIPKHKMPKVSTVHSLAYSIIKENNKTRYIVIDDYQQYVLLSRTLQNLRNGKIKSHIRYNAKHKPHYYLQLFSLYNLNGRNNDRMTLDMDEQKVFNAYNDMKLYEKRIDFQDMIYYAYELLQNPYILKTYKDVYKYIIVDEFQDISYCGFQIIKLLASNNDNLVVVGDPKQGIFGSFAGSSIEFIQDYDKIFKGASIYNLKKTYRNPIKITKVANHIAKHLNDIEITTNRTEQGNIIYTKYDNSSEQASLILDKIQNENMNINDTAILYRANSSSMWFQKECILRDIPFYTKSASFLETSIAKMMLGYMRLVLTGCSDIQSFIDIANKPNRFIKTSDIAKLHKKNKASSLSDIIYSLGQNSAITLFENLVDISSTISLLPQEKQVFEALRRCGVRFNFVDYFNNEFEQDVSGDVADFSEFMKEIKSPERLFKILNKVEDSRKNKKGLNLLTIHASKGAEFENVFLTSINENVLPHKNNSDKLEELRLFYVAVTRTKNNLYLSTTRSHNGKTAMRSSFMDEYFGDL